MIDKKQAKTKIYMRKGWYNTMRKNKIIAMMMAAVLVCTTFTGCGEKDSATATGSVEVSESVLESEDTAKESLAKEESKAAEESKTEEESKVAEESKAEEASKAAEESKAEEASKAAEESKQETESKTEAPTVSEAPAATLPGINRNGRYADIPESVLPSNVAANAEFVDEPIYTKPWPDVTGTIYADYMRTQVIKVAEYGVDDCSLIAYCAEDEENGLYGNCVVIYNGQYAIINEVLFAVWVNGIDPEYN